MHPAILFIKIKFFILLLSVTFLRIFAYILFRGFITLDISFADVEYATGA
jgi:hypothetical protein